MRITGGIDENGNSGEFYRGRVTSPSGSGNVVVHYNRICRPRMQYGAPSFTTRTANSICQPQSFSVSRSTNNGSSWTSVVTTTFRPDWSYRTFNDSVKSVPITRAFHPRMCLLYTVVEGSASSINGWYNTGGSNVNTAISGMSGSKTASYPLALISATGIKSVGLGTLTWDKPANCAPGAIYYRNPYGGWDAFCIEGSLVESNAPQRWTRKINWTNIDITNRGEQNYASEVVKRWTVHTGWLTDAESAKMWLLLTSNEAYIHDFAKDTILPVILEDGSQDEKTYKNMGRKMVSYTITLRLAQDRLTM